VDWRAQLRIVNLLRRMLVLLCGVGFAFATPRLELEKIERLAESGDASAQFSLGLKHYNGDGVIKDATEAAKWIRKSAEQGHAAAQAYLGHMYKKGDGVIRDVAESAKWIRKSAERGYAVAQYNLAVLYEEGLLGTVDIVEAHAWYNLASSGGDKSAKEVLADIEKEMTREQISEATKRAKIYFEKIEAKKK
jgi:TPR repeat protein